MELNFFIEMDEIPTTTQQQKKFSFKNKRMYEPVKVKQARILFRHYLSQYKPKESIKGAVQLEVMWCFPKTKKAKHGERKITKPDLDNLQKMLQDVMAELGYFENDARISDLILKKRYSNKVGIRIKLKKLEINDTEFSE